MDYTQRLEEAFRGLGLDERTAKIAAIGRATPPAVSVEGFAANLQAISGRPVREVVRMVRGRDDTPLSEVRAQFDEAARPVAETRHLVVDGVRMTEAQYIKHGSPQRRTASRTASRRRVQTEPALSELAEPKPGDDAA